jgi:hypothetical protein
MNLAAKIVALNESLSGADVPHAFGGAIALAYCTLDPRGTSDIDLNIFVPASTPDHALDALPKGVVDRDDRLGNLVRDGQVRLWWGEHPVDLFFDYVELHRQAASNSRLVPFYGTEIPVLGPVELATFKAMFNRTRDWADLEAMVAAQTLQVSEVSKLVAGLVGEDDPRLARLAALIS